MMPIEDWSSSTHKEFADFMLGEKLGRGMSREVYQHPFDETKVIKVENSAKHFQNVMEWQIWNDFKHCADVAKWLAPCHSISYSGTFLIMDKVDDLPLGKEIKKLPEFLSDHKRENFGVLRGKIVARDYASSLISFSTIMRNWREYDAVPK